MKVYQNGILKWDSSVMRENYFNRVVLPTETHSMEKKDAAKATRVTDAAPLDIKTAQHGKGNSKAQRNLAKQNLASGVITSKTSAAAAVGSNPTGVPQVVAGSIVVAAATKKSVAFPCVFHMADTSGLFQGIACDRAASGGACVFSHEPVLSLTKAVALDSLKRGGRSLGKKQLDELTAYVTANCT